MRIGELSAQTQISVRALRYYEEHGLLTAERTTSGQRVYGTDAVERVRLLRRLYSAGLNSATIAALLPCVDTPSDEISNASIELMRGEHARISEQINQLIATRDDLSHIIDAAAAYRREHQSADSTLVA
jgi:DNA-binding transcriptional MerR regulator